MKLNLIQHFYHNMRYIVHPSRPDKEGKAFTIIVGIWAMILMTTIPLLIYPSLLSALLVYGLVAWYLYSITYGKRAEIAQFYQDLDQETALTYKKRSYWALFIFILYVVAFLYIGTWLDFI